MEYSALSPAHDVQANSNRNMDTISNLFVVKESEPDEGYSKVMTSDRSKILSHKKNSKVHPVSFENEYASPSHKPINPGKQ